MKLKIFGTDGIRDIAGKKLNCTLALKLGMAIGNIICKNKKSKILIGKDTRISSDMLESALTAGLCACGIDVCFLGIIPTGAVCFLTTHLKADAGIMISASHNSFEYNGIKIFDKNGYKLNDETEYELEKFLLNEENNMNEVYAENIGKVYSELNFEEEYEKNIVNIFKKTNIKNKNKIKIAIDCANGAACFCAPKIFKKIGFSELEILNNTPDGKNINKNCGSTEPESLCEFVIKNKFDLGVAFDGDADRCICVDENGKIIDGDNIMAVCAIELLKNKELENLTVVGTPMSNLGFINFLKSKKINFLETKVGDRYIIEELTRNNFNFGGEQSGHIIFKNHRTTGDGILTAVMLINSILNNDIKASYILKMFNRIPQIIVNTRSNEENYTDKITSEIKKLINEEDKLFIRASGTEPLVRIMVQSYDESKLELIRNLYSD